MWVVWLLAQAVLELVMKGRYSCAVSMQHTVSGVFHVCKPRPSCPTVAGLLHAYNRLGARVRHGFDAVTAAWLPGSGGNCQDLLNRMGLAAETVNNP